VAAAGCAKPDPSLIQVAGSVLLGTKPLTSGTVIFHPDASKGNDSRDEPRSPIGLDGRYRLQNGVKQGVDPGWYKVTVSAAKMDPKSPYITDWLIPVRYVDPKTSNLRLEVVANAVPGAYDIKLEPK
jgi:hypothetical protein